MKKASYKADRLGFESLAEVVVSRLLQYSNVEEFVKYEKRDIPGIASRVHEESV